MWRKLLNFLGISHSICPLVGINASNEKEAFAALRLRFLLIRCLFAGFAGNSDLRWRKEFFDILDTMWEIIVQEIVRVPMFFGSVRFLKAPDLSLWALKTKPQSYYL